MEPIKLSWHFFIHILVGTLIFVGIGTASVILHWFVKWAESQQVSSGLVIALQALEYFVFAVDALSYAWFVIILAAKFMKEIYRSANEH